VKRIFTFMMTVVMVSLIAMPAWSADKYSKEDASMVCDMVTDVSKIVMAGILSGMEPRKIMIACFDGAQTDDVRLACGIMLVDAITYPAKDTEIETLKAFAKDKRDECFSLVDKANGKLEKKTSL